MAAARLQLAEGRELALRGIADAIGMSSPALYRYVASRRQLIDLVAETVDAEAVREVESDVARYPAGDPGARWVAGWAGYRQWALRHGGEFRLLVAHPRSGGEQPLSLREASDNYLGTLLHDLWAHRGFDVPPAPAGAVRRPPPGGRSGRREADWSAELEWLHTRVGASQIGIITLEVTGYVEAELVANGVLFRENVVDWLPRLGLGPEVGRLTSVIDAELSVR
ncbi:TetR/AcrR family transcriptional regulator [Nocardioides montaniterrae]